MLLVNLLGRTIDVEDEKSAKYLASKRFRLPTEQEKKQYTLRVQERLSKAQQSPTLGAYFSTVPNSADGYGTTRHSLKRELADRNWPLIEHYAGQKVGLLYNYPYSLSQMPSEIRIIYTMFESDKIPEDWPDYLDLADEVIVPSKWCAEVFAKSGINATVVPLGYDHDVFQYIEREEQEIFTFVHYNSMNMRKGFFEVFEAFNKEFGKDEKVKLILKTTFLGSPIPILSSQYPNIEIVRGKFSSQELLELLGRCDCMVYPSRGEGFGLTPLEAMATGLPAIVPNAHGISEYFNADYMLEVKVKELSPAVYNRFNGQDTGQMVTCDVDDLRKQMRYSFENRSKMRRLGRKASEYVKAYTVAKTAEKLSKILTKWQRTDIVKHHDSKYLLVEKI